MSQWMALSFTPPVLGELLPSARWIVPSIFSSNSMFFMWRVMRRVAADAELAEPARALVGVERRDQELLAASADASTTRPPSKRSRIAAALAPEVDGRELGERDHALGRVLDRRGEELAAREVLPARVDRELPPRDRQRQVGLGADDAHLVGRVEELGVAAHALALGIPVAQHRGVEEVGELVGRHAGVLGERGGRELAADPLEVVVERSAPSPGGRPSCIADEPLLRQRVERPRVFSGASTAMSASIRCIVSTSIGDAFSSSSSGASRAQAVGADEVPAEARPHERVGAAPGQLPRRPR